MSGQRREPVPGPGRATGWEGFTTDPRSPDAAELRAGNADREYAASLLQRASSEGRLTRDEYTARLASAQAARDLGQLVPLVSDVMVLPAAAAPRAAGARRGRALISWFTFTGVVVAVWLVTCIAAQQWLYFWPIWPMLATVIPLFLTLGRTSGGQRDRGRQERRDARDERRQVRRQGGYEPRELGRGDAAVSANDQQASGLTQPPQEYPLYRPDDLR